jgi:hypothetical protein
MTDIFEIPGENSCMQSKIYFWIAIILSILTYIVGFFNNTNTIRNMLLRTTVLAANIMMILFVTYGLNKLCENENKNIAYGYAFLFIIMSGYIR